MLLQLAVTAGKRAFRRRALRRPHPARREVTCGDTDMDWPRLGAVLHMTGLWGRSYLGVGRRTTSRTWQKLCQREDTGLCICAMLLRDTAMLRLDLPPPRAVLAGSPPDCGRVWWEPWARIQGGLKTTWEYRPEHKALFAYQKCLEVPDPFDGSERGQERCLKRQKLQSSGSKGPLWSPARTIERSQEGTRGDLEGFILLAPFWNLMMRSYFPRDRPSTASWWATIAATYTFLRWRVTAYAPTFLAGKKALLQSCIFGGLLGEKNTSSRTDSISVSRFALLKEL